MRGAESLKGEVAAVVTRRDNAPARRLRSVRVGADKVAAALSAPLWKAQSPPGSRGFLYIEHVLNIVLFCNTEA